MFSIIGTMVSERSKGQSEEVLKPIPTDRSYVRELLRHPVLGYEQEQLLFTIGQTKPEGNPNDFVPNSRSSISISKAMSHPHFSGAMSLFTPADALRCLDLAGESRSLNELIVRLNIKLVHDFAQKFYSSGVPLVDMVDTGIVPLVLCVDRFNPYLPSSVMKKRNLTFASYAGPAINNAIYRSLNQSGMTGVITQVAEASQKDFAEAVDELSQALGHEPSQSEIREYLSGGGRFAPNIIDELLINRSQAVTTSLNSPLEEDVTEGSEILDFVADEGLDVADEAMAAAIISLLENSDVLTPREREGLRLYFLEDIRSEEIAGVLSIHMQTVMRERRKALIKIRAALGVDSNPGEEQAQREVDVKKRESALDRLRSGESVASLVIATGFSESYFRNLAAKAGLRMGEQYQEKLAARKELRERQITMMLAKKKSPREIAMTLGCSITTVANYIKRIQEQVEKT